LEKRDKVLNPSFCICGRGKERRKSPFYFLLRRRQKKEKGKDLPAKTPFEKKKEKKK